jgi:N-acetylglucosaminyldiphosphoundecaprenol N-acetyl-beta-D-mannosaminyltransferase
MREKMGISYENIIGFRVVNSGILTCLDEIVTRLSKGGPQCYFVCVNPHSLEVAKKDILFHKAIENADIVVPDGIGIVIASKLFGGTIRQRITGSDIFGEVNKLLNKESRYSCFFLGSTEMTLHKIKERMGNNFPNIKIVGILSPPFKEDFTDDENDFMIEIINRANPDILWVGMTAPKQEKWIYKNREKLQAKFIGAIGAVFDFYAGTKNRSHPWFQEHGIEWLPRLLREPRRLWRRNLISNPSFLLRVFLARLKSAK